LKRYFRQEDIVPDAGAYGGEVGLERRVQISGCGRYRGRRGEILAAYLDDRRAAARAFDGHLPGATSRLAVDSNIVDRDGVEPGRYQVGAAGEEQA